jgi:hypothetical protein
MLRHARSFVIRQNIGSYFAAPQQRRLTELLLIFGGDGISAVLLDSIGWTPVRPFSGCAKWIRTWK